MSEELRVLCVCTYNRTRSVLMGAFLQHPTVGTEGPRQLSVRTGGFRETGLPPTPDTTHRLLDMGIDVRGHRSTRLTREVIDRADLVLTAEQAHVLQVATLSQAAFDRTFTLPEFVGLAQQTGPRGSVDFGSWLTVVGRDRPRDLTYLDTPVGDVEDPTGRAPDVWDKVIEEIVALCDDVQAVIR